MQLPSVGDTFDHRFRIERELGRGGFACVFAAEQVMTGAKVALKVLMPGQDGAYELDMRRRFLREGNLLAQIEHPNILRLLHTGEAEGLLYMATEVVAGEDLSVVLQARGPFATDEVVHVLRQLLTALGAAHGRGLIHRDLKPENIRLSPTSDDPLRVKLLDFGIARAAESGAPALTKTGELIGTPRYMAPEQLTERPATPASDIYALGIIGFELLLGRDALHGGAWGDQLDRLLAEHVVAVDRQAEIEPRLRRVLQRMTAVKPEARYQAAEAVLRALNPDSPQPVEVAHNTRRPIAAVIIVILVAVAVFAVLWEPDSPPNKVEVPVVPTSLTAVEQPPTPPPPKEPVDAAPEVDFGPYASSGCEQPADDPLRAGLKVRVPESCEGRACPLVIAFHGDAMTPRQMASLLAGHADRHGFLLVAPNGGDRAWQAYGEEHMAIAQGAFQEAAGSSCVDRSRVFLAGYSDGVDPVVQSRCQTWVTATAVFGSTFRPVEHEILQPGFMCIGPAGPILWMHPEDSPQVPWDTNSTCADDDEKLGYDDVVGVLRRLHGCSAASDAVELGFGTSCLEWECKWGVTSCGVSGGKLWKGAPTDLLDDPFGRCEERESDADIGEVMWSFFESVEPLATPPDPESLVPPL